MVKKVLIGLIVAFGIILALSNVYAQLYPSNVSINKVYTSSQVFEGKFYALMQNYPVDSLMSLSISSLPVQSKPLKEFLASNNVSYNCTPENCLPYYTIQNPETSKVINGDSYISFVATGEDIQVDSLEFDMLGENIKPDCFVSPVTIDLLDDMHDDWKYLEPGNGYCGYATASDSYSDSSASYKYNLYSSPYCEKIRLPIAKRFNLSADINPGPNIESIDVQISIGNSGWNENKNSICSLPLSYTAGIVGCEADFVALENKEYDVCIRINPDKYDSSLVNPMIKGETIDPWSGYAAGNTKVDFALYAQPAGFANFSEVGIVTFDNGHFWNIPANAPPGKELMKYLQDYISSITNKTNDCNAYQCIIPIHAKTTQNITFSELKFRYYQGGALITESQFFDAIKNSALLTASGLLDVRNEGFRVPVKYNSYDFNLKIGADPIASGSLSVVKLPNIMLSPLNASAGIPRTFNILIDENASAYYWDFGDGANTKTTSLFASHSYNAIGNYTITIIAQMTRALNVTRSFSVSVGPPKGVVNSTINQKISYLASFQSNLNSLPDWQKSIASEQINLAEMLTTLDSYRTESLNPNADFVALQSALNNFVVYKGIKSEEIGKTPLQQTVNPDLLQKAGAGTVQDTAALESNIANWQGFIGASADATVKIAESEIPSQNVDLLSVVTIKLIPTESLGKVFVIINGISGAKFPADESHQAIDGSELLVFDNLTGEKDIQFAIAGRYNPSDIEIITSPEFSKFLVGEYYCGNQICDSDKGESYQNCPEDCPKPPTNKIIYAILVFIAVAAAIFWIWKVYAKIYENNLEKKLFKNKADLYNLTFFITKALNKNEPEESIKKRLTEAKWLQNQIDFAFMKIKKERRTVQFNTLKNFITAELRANKTEDIIKAELKDAGWQQKDIDYAYKKTLKGIDTFRAKMISGANIAQRNVTANAGGIKKRNILLVYLFSIITLGIYGVIWMVLTRKEINMLGGDIPTAWLLIVPIANIYWLFKYAECFAKNVKKDNNAALWFILFLFVGIITPAVVQSELNKFA